MESALETPTKKTKSTSRQLPDNHGPDISVQIQFRSNTKAANLIRSVGALKMKSFGKWDPKDEFQDYDKLSQLIHMIKLSPPVKVPVGKWKIFSLAMILTTSIAQLVRELI